MMTRQEAIAVSRWLVWIGMILAAAATLLATIAYMRGLYLLYLVNSGLLLIIATAVVVAIRVKNRLEN